MHDVFRDKKDHMLGRQFMRQNLGWKPGTAQVGAPLKAQKARRITSKNAFVLVKVILHRKTKKQERLFDGTENLETVATPKPQKGTFATI